MRNSLFARTIAAGAFCLCISAAAAAPKKVLVVTATQGFRHSSIPLAEKVIAGLGEETGLFTVDYARGGPNGKEKTGLEKLAPDALKNYDAVIFASTTGDLPLPDRDGFIAWVKGGGAFVGMHAASDTFHGYPPYIEMLGGEFLTHHSQAAVQCINMDRNSPETRHLGAKYPVFDEIYLLKNFHRDQVHGLLTLDKHPNTGLPGDYPIAWCKQFGQGKVFYTSLGHREDVWLSENYQKHILGGIEWALGLQRGNATPQSTKPRLTRAEQEEGFKPLFDGADLDGWALREKEGTNSWSAQNGMLVNQEHGKDLVSDEKFRDFVIRYEYMVPTNSNSGLYLRGRYEIQILDDSHRKKAEMGGNGAIYNVSAPSELVSRPAGQWQSAQATIKGNKISVILNGVKIQDNVEVSGPTGGALDQNTDQPGPIMLQGDHGAVAFRNIRIKSLD